MGTETIDIKRMRKAQEHIMQAMAPYGREGDMAVFCTAAAMTLQQTQEQAIAMFLHARGQAQKIAGLKH